MAIQTATISQLNPVDNIELGDKIEIERNGNSAHTTLNSVLTRIANLETSEGNNKGQFDTPLQLQTAYPTPTQGWYAYINSTTSQWRVNISNEWYDTEQDIKDNVYSKQQVDEFLNTKVDKLTLPEEVQDIMSTTLVDTPTVDFVYNDENNNITANIKDDSITDIHIANNANIETSKIKQTTFAPINDLPSNGDSQNVVNNKIIGTLNNKQNAIDNALTTTNKNVVGAINELKTGKNVKIWYVSGGVNGAGNDNNNGYNQNNAFASLAKLNTVLNSTGEQVVLLPSQLTESATFTQQNIEITGSEASHRGICGTSGTITSNHSASSQTYSYFSCGSFVKQNAYVRLYDLSITNSFSDSGSGVIDAYNVLFNATTPISITGSGNKNFYNQRGGIFAINNASALVNVITNDFISQFTLTAGLLFIKNAIVYIAQGTTFTIGTSGATFIAEGVRFMYPDNTVAKINIPTGVNYSMQNGCIYDIANSTLNGTNVASLYKGYFDNVILNTVNLKNSTASTLIATDSNKNIQSLSTGTYPSLQELSYVKGLTSSVQDQLNAKESVITNGTTSQYFRGDKTFQTLDKIAVGLSNVDNTSDSNKPISNATQTALDLKENAFIKNNAFNKNFGNTAGTVCEGNDARLSTNLSVANQTATQLTIVSDTGNDATLTSATTTVAGLLSATDKTKLDNTSNTNTGDETGETIYTKFKDKILSGTNVSITTDDTNKTITINSTGGGGGGGSGTDTIGSVKVFHQSFIPDATWQPTGATYNSATYPIMADKLAGRTVQPVQETRTNEYFPNGASDRALYFPHIFYAESDTGVILYLDANGNGAILTNNANNTDLVYQSYDFRSKNGNRGYASTVAWVKDSTTGIGYFVTQIWDNADNSTLRITEADLLAGLNWTNLGSNRPGTVGVLRSDKNNTLIYTPMGYKTGAHRSINAGTSWTPITYPYQPVNTTSCTSNLMAPVHNGTVWFIVFPGTFNSATSVDGLTWTGRNNLQFVQQFDGSGSVQWTYFWHTTLFTGGINNKNFYFTPQPNDYCNYNYFYQYSFYSVNDGVNVRLCTNPGTPHQGWYGNGFMAISNVAGNSDKVYYSSDMSSNWLSQTFANTYFGGTGAFIYSAKYKKAYTSTYKFSISYSLNTTFTVPSHNISLNTTNYAALIKMG